MAQSIDHFLVSFKVTDTGLSPIHNFFAYMKYVVLVFTFLMAGVEVPLERFQTKMNETKIVEMAMFYLNDEVPLEEGKRAMEALNQFISQQPGFLNRKTSISEDEQFLDLVYWTDLTSAKTASAKAMNDPTLLQHFSVINQQRMTFKHFEVFLSQ